MEEPERAKQAIIAVGEGRGFIVNTDPRLVVTAAPFCRPKLQAILARSDTGQGHAEWLKELKGYVEQEESEADDDDGPVIEHATANGNDPEQLSAEPDEPTNGEDVSDQAGVPWTPSGADGE